MWPLVKRDARKVWKQPPTTPSKKKTKKRNARKRESKKILLNLYYLPLDIKVKIFQMAVLINQENWIDDFMEKSLHTYNFISYPTYWEINRRGVRRLGAILNGYSEWKKKKNSYRYKYKPPCERMITKTHTLTICNNINGDINCRELTNNQFWYHKKCRCITCDRVRYTGRENLPVPEKWKYSNIEWINYSRQWKTKPNVLWPGQEIHWFGWRAKE
tara:strand:+ start:1562 stop:2209 length:648 start_codon:yes stop_codon:yes gene_type:complete